jgi:hypothetical protein
MLGDPPRDLGDNKLWRAFLLDRANANKRVREYLIDRCTHECTFWINSFVYQYNPNFIAGGKWEEVGVFVTEEFQEEALEVIAWCILNKKDLVIDKSREMGASWLCILKQTHSTTFEKWKKFLCISRNKDAVDSADDPDSLFWKIDFVLEHLPPWMTDRRFEFAPNGKIKRTQMQVINELTKSRITGQATSGAAGVGGRATAMFIDEYSLIREDWEILAHTANTTSCRIFNGTQRGTEKAFFDLTEKGKRGLLRYLGMHWTKHPDKFRGAYRFDKPRNKVIVLDPVYKYSPEFRFQYTELPIGGPAPGVRSPYYDDQCVKQGNPRAIAQNLDMDATGAVGPVFNPVTIRALIAAYAQPARWEGHLQYDLDTGKPIALVPMPGGPLRLWINPPPSLKVEDLPPMDIALGCDISTGVGATPSICAGASKNTGEKILEYCTRDMPPERFAEAAAATGWAFKNAYGTPALLCWERNGPGTNFGKRVYELNYPNLWYGVKKVSVGGYQKAEQAGWHASTEGKDQLITSYMFAISTRQFIERCELTLKECLQYRWKGGHVSHPEQEAVGARDNRDQGTVGVNHGDRPIASGLAWKMIKEELGFTTVLDEKKPKGPPPPNSIAGRMAMTQQEQSQWREASGESGWKECVVV